MNKEYTYLDGKCIITDENGKKRVEEFTDKTEDILIEENVIETLENDLEDTKEELIKKIKKSKRMKSDIWFNLFMLISPLLAAQITFSVLLGPGTFNIMHPLISKFIKVFFTFFGIVFGGTGFLTTYINSQENKKCIKGLISKKEVIEKTLEEKKDYLEKLNNQKQKEKLEETFYDKKIDDLERLQNLRSYLELYYDCGYNYDKYNRYLQEEKLNKRLGRYYTKEEIELVEEFIEANEENNQMKLTRRTNK